MKSIQFLIASVIIAFTGQLAVAQNTAPDSVTTNFIHNATVGGIKEVNAGRLAAKNGQSPRVKAFGARMIKDHTKANAQLTALVQKKGYQVTPPSSAELAADPMLTNTSGAAFDKNYVSMMVVDHQNTIKIFENASLNSSDPDIKAFATQTLPALRQHLASIQAIAASTGANVQ